MIRNRKTDAQNLQKETVSIEFESRIKFPYNLYYIFKFLCMQPPKQRKKR